ncbi:protein MCM10 homolog [Aricia agestis]|uniref:protein MCM10 homolog n=1 Tax=Aricia agestis TaxID=91739 RepID=UPI001C201BC0|nr:protein MCM10 homolog [Aricia agestis]
MEANDELSQLEELLRADLNGSDEKCNKIVEVDIFKTNNIQDKEQNVAKITSSSVVHNGDTDSSEDEEKRNYSERKYNDYGMSIKKNLDSKENELLERRIEFETRLRQANNEAKTARKPNPNPATSNQEKSAKAKNMLCVPQASSKQATDIYTDPIFGIRIAKPLVSSSVLLDRMQGREAVNMLRMKRYVENEDMSKDWVVGGVIVRKSAAKKSQKGNQFLIWTLSDLKDDLKTVSMFLFRKAYNDLWKTPEGTVVAVLNPNVLDKSQNSSDQACLSVETSDRVMVLGQSKDLGFCKSKKKNGEPCTSFVNLNQCEHCIYHIKQEYQKYSQRQELQSSTMGKGLPTLQNKVFGKSTFIYGGKSYSALPKSNQKVIKDRDQNRLMSLSDYHESESQSLMINKAPCSVGQLKNNNTILHSPTVSKVSDTQRLNSLNSSKCSPTTSLADKVKNSPKLGFGLRKNDTVDLSLSYGQKAAERAKQNAIRLIQKSGGLSKLDPMSTKGTEVGKKRALDKIISENENSDCKRIKSDENLKNTKGVMSERFKKILEATSAHTNLIKQHEDDEQEKYFNKLEKKEAMEEKMLNTFKLACKAVRCTKCKYTAFSAAQRCKDERHPLKVLDTFKRFFKCADCKNRTVSLELLPLHSCSNCNGSRWEKAPMLREKKVTSLCDGLSIRGAEETFIGGTVTAGKNINLLVPDDS